MPCPPYVDPKVLAVADCVLARNCSVITAIEEGLVAFVDSKSEEVFAATSAATYLRAATLAATAAAVAAAKAVKAAAAPKKVAVKELTGTKMTRGQASGKRKLDKQAKRGRVKAFKTACLQYAEVKEAGGLTAQQVCSWVGNQMCQSPASAPKPGSVRKQVALGLAGESPGKRGRKFRI